MTGRQTVSVLTVSVSAWKAHLSNKFFIFLQQEQGEYPLKHCPVFIASYIQSTAEGELMKNIIVVKKGGEK